jgi:Flp pilus assembly pilin Flp
MNHLRHFQKLCGFCIGNDEDGQTLVEYGMIVSLLAMAVVLILTVVGQDVVSLFTGFSTHLQNATGP